MAASHRTYASKALSQIPRLLSNQDRNPFSPTYGCFHRDYWLDKTSDFPDAVRQFAVHALALVYKCDLPGNIYHGQTKVRDWAIAGLSFWAHIQHKDGSFDEFYPYERGWVGPSAFTTFTSIEAYNLLRDEISTDVAKEVQDAIYRAASFIAAGESEEDHLANHHAMACLATWKAYRLLGDPALKEGYQHLWQGFLRYHNIEEGWSREYDGADPGYLSATVSFLSKIYQDNRDPTIFNVLRQSVEFSSYFVYPNGFYAGSMGSRNTLHFYPHGFEILAAELPLAAAVAEKMLAALGEGKLVPPEIMSDRYLVYRVPEFLQAYLDYSERPNDLPPLPYEREPFTRYFPAAGIFVANRPSHYVIANLVKGGVVKVFDQRNGRLLISDCGLIGRLEDGRVVSSQWIDPQYECRADDNGWEVRGQLQEVPSHKVFTPFKNLLFRGMLVALGWSPRFSHWLKGAIRKTLMLGSRPVPVQFRRQFHVKELGVELLDELKMEKNVRFESLAVGDEFFVRYVPQSRYFQGQELDIVGRRFDQAEIAAANAARGVNIRRMIAADCVTWKVQELGMSQPTIETDSRTWRIRLAEHSGWAKNSSRFRGALLLAVTLVVFYLLFQRIDLGQVFTILGRIPPLTWVLAGALTLSFPALSAVRWNLILRTMGYNISFYKCLLIIVGVWPLSAISPAKSGDLLKAFGLRKEISVVVVAGSVLTERGLDLLMLAGFALAGGLIWQDGRIIIVASTVLLAVLVAFTMARLNLKWPVGNDVRAKIRDLFRSMQVLGRKRLPLAAILVLTAANWFASILQTKLLFDGVGASVTLGFTTAALPVAIFVGLLPVTFAGMGTRDTAFVVLFSAFATAPQALAVGLLYSFFGYWSLAVLGLPFVKRALGY